MSSYPKPTNWTQSPFNPANWPSYSDFITIASANKRYLSKIGDDTDVGNLTLKQKLYFGDTTLGIYKPAANTLYFRCNSLDVFACTDAQIIHTGYIEAGTGFRTSGLGSVSLVSYGTNTLNTGMYFESGNKVSFSCNGIKKVSLDTTGLFVFNSGITGYTPTSLYAYCEQQITTTFKWGSTGTQTGNKVCRIIRIGGMSFFQMPSWAETITNGTGLAVNVVMQSFWDSAVYGPVAGSGLQTAVFVPIVNGVNTGCLMYVNAGTSYLVIAPITGGFPNGTTLNCYGGTISWIAA